MQIVIDKDKEINKLKKTLNNLTDENDIQSINFAIFMLENIGTPMEERKTNALRPCPFCGEKMKVMYSDLRGEYIFSHEAVIVKCPFISFEMCGCEASTLNEAINIWNRRHKDGDNS